MGSVLIGHVITYKGHRPPTGPNDPCVYEGISTGKILTTGNSDGWEFKDRKTNRFVRVSGDCVIEN